METNYSGTLRISNSKTLQRWIDNGSYQKRLADLRWAGLITKILI